MTLLCIDFETQDPYLGDGAKKPSATSRNVGAGWVYGINLPQSDFKVLGAAVRTKGPHDSWIVQYITNWEILKTFILASDGVVMHNAQYDLGCLYFIYAKDAEIMAHIRRMDVYDTLLMSKFYQSHHMSHSLDNCSKRYLGKEKHETELLELAIAAGLISNRLKSEASKMQSVKKQMALLQEMSFETVAKYAMVDAELTWELFTYFKERVDLGLVKRYGNIYKMLVEQRIKGIRLDLNRARELDKQLDADFTIKMRRLKELAGDDFNINSSKQTAEIFKSQGLEFDYTDKGNPCFSKAALGSMDHELALTILDVKKIKKIKTDFIKKFLEMQQYTCPGATDYGRIYPEFNLLSARTGRFSCSSPNVQQIPSDAVYGPLCRSIFVPEEGEQWFSLDYSNQEGRLQMHYAKVLKCKGADQLIRKMSDNPHYDLHQEVADLIGTSRKIAKGINLGLSYGMGLAKLAAQLGISEDEARKLKAKYFRVMPYLEELIKKCSNFLKANGYIDTVSGRCLTLEPPNEYGQDFSYKGLNMLIQGSAVDQTTLAMIKAHELGITKVFAVHDELNMSGTVEQAKQLQQCMLEAVSLHVPVVAEIESGNNWGEC